jgi:hypothetical protein
VIGVERLLVLHDRQGVVETYVVALDAVGTAYRARLEVAPQLALPAPWLVKVDAQPLPEIVDLGALINFLST